MVERRLAKANVASSNLVFRSKRTISSGLMAIDMKVEIAEAARKLLMEKKVKKLTVKDIVDECHITRQAFYYHFEDIPDMFRWVLEKGAQLIREAGLGKDGEERLRYFMLMAINALPRVKKSIQTNYGDEIVRILTQQVYDLFEQTVEENNLYQQCSRSELKFILRYHSQAIMGILANWTEEDTKNLDKIVHQIYFIMTEGVSPFS